MASPVLDMFAIVDACWMKAFILRGDGRGEGGCTHFTHGRNRMTVEPRIPTSPGRSSGGGSRSARNLNCVA